MRRRTTDGIAGVGTESNGAEARGDGGGGAAARAGGDPIERIRIVRIAREN